MMDAERPGFLRLGTILRNIHRLRQGGRLDATFTIYGRPDTVPLHVLSNGEIYRASDNGVPIALHVEDFERGDWSYAVKNDRAAAANEGARFR